MIVKKVTFQKNFQVAQFLFERYEWEIELEDGQTPEEATKECRARVEALHSEFNPHLFNDAQKQRYTTWQDEVDTRQQESEFDEYLARDIESLKAITYKEDAQAFLDAEAWRQYNMVLKSLVNAKPNKE